MTLTGDDLKKLIAENARLRQDLARERLRNRDLHIVVKDQQNHIKNLEAELLPHLRVGVQAEQESML